jgi:putative ABC transport system permease protein
MLTRSPAFTAIAVLTLALGIGANTAIFSVVNAVLLNPFPYRDHSRLMLIRQSLPKIGIGVQTRSSGPEFFEYKEQDGIFEQIAAWEPVSRNLTGGIEPERVAAAKVSGDLFDMLGIAPVLGRTIDNGDQGPKAEPVLVLSYALWQSRFGGEESILGQKVALDDDPYTVIGVMPQNFGFDGGSAWFPFPMELDKLDRKYRQFAVIARLKQGISIDQAQAELDVEARRVEQNFAGVNPEYEGRGITVTPYRDWVLGTMRPALLVLIYAVTAILLIACVNIANLLLVRAVKREKEIAIRTALGASRIAIIRQLLAESLLLAAVGGGLALLLASWGIDALLPLIPENTITQGLAINIDGTVLVYTMAVSILTSLLFGLWPAFNASRVNLSDSIKEGSQKASLSLRGRRSQSILVVSEIALSLVLLVSAGLMITSFARLTRVDPGFDAEHVLSMRINLPPARYRDSAQRADFFEQVIDRVSKLPGVESAGVASHMPFVYTENATFTVETESVDPSIRTLNIDTRTVSTGYFRTLGVRLLQGEEFSPQDRGNTPPVIIVNRTLAEKYWPDQEAVGKRIMIVRPNRPGVSLTVKGVVEDSAQMSLDIPVNPEIYFTLAQNAGAYRRMNLAVRSGANPHSLAGSIVREIQSIDKDQPVYQVQTLEELIGISIAARRLVMFLLALFSGIAMLLAAVGIYGVMTNNVSQRTHEIGIRMALGADRRDVLMLIARRGMLLVGAGVVTGLIGAFAATRLLASLLFEVTATDPLTFVAVTAFLVAVAMAACYMPARRATKLDPIVALRYE